MPRVKRILGLLLLVALALDLSPSIAQGSASPVEDLIAHCPSSAAVAAINADLEITFEGDPTAGSLVCHASDGSVDLTRFQERAYQALRVMKALRFSRSLPWTSQNLYDWFVASIDGIRFRADTVSSFCCDPVNVINILASSNSSALFTNRWIAATDPVGLEGLLAVLVHEARHNNGKPHTCGSDDQTVGELGAWGAEYYLELWEALYSGSFLTSPDVYPTYYRDQHLRISEIFLPHFCSLPNADLSLAIGAGSPSPAVRGQNVAYTFTATNSGPDTADDVFVYSPVPLGAKFVQATASQGSCSAEAGGPIACSFGSIASGAVATANVSLLVDPASTESVITDRESPAALGARVIGPDHDPNAANDSAFFTTPVVSSPNRPPDCSTVSATPARLWPPNGKLRRVTIAGATDPDGDLASITVSAVTQDEPVDRDSTSPDAIAGETGHEVLLRSERDGNGDGRAYRVAFTASDGKGGTCSGTALIGVPHDMGNHVTPIDSSPPSYNSFGS
jgi:uncharacterized repeat protein (TIGR01451 family)